MKVEMLLLAEAARAADGKLYIHGAGITRIETPMLPWTQPQLAVVGRLALVDDDQGTTYQVAISIRDADDVVVLAPATVPIEIGDVNAKDEDAFVNLALTISPITFRKTGVHWVDLEIDGEPARRLRLAVGPTSKHLHDFTQGN